MEKNKDYNLSEKREGLKKDIRDNKNPLLSFGLNIMEIVEKQDKEFIKKAIEFSCCEGCKEMLRQLAGSSLAGVSK